jgi:hypothetical protein
MPFSGVSDINPARSLSAGTRVRPGIIPVLIKVIQEQDATIRAQQAAIKEYQAALKGKYAELAGALSFEQIVERMMWQGDRADK